MELLYLLSLVPRPSALLERVLRATFDPHPARGRAWGRLALIAHLSQSSCSKPLALLDSGGREGVLGRCYTSLSVELVETRGTATG